MKIVKRSAFLALPAGTVFAHYAHEEFGPIRIKGSTDPTTTGVRCQWLVEYAAIDHEHPHVVVDEAIRSGSSFEMASNFTVRDGTFDDEESLYVVLEPKEVEALIERLQLAAQGVGPS
jgi:hypothetical protein